MWPILACSVIGVAVILERTFFFSRLALQERQFHEDLRRAWQDEDLRAMRAAVASSSHPVAEVVRATLEASTKPANVRADLVRKTGSEQLDRVERRLKILAAISHLSPLLGLLGTVLGMVFAFAQIEALAGAVNPGDLAGGIWEALLTTVFGLAVAIPCMAAYHGFEATADRLSRRMQFATIEAESLVNPNGSTQPMPEPASDHAPTWNAVES